METRKITIISTKGQKKTTIETTASTVAELKVDMNKAGIEFEGMALYEGVSKTNLVNDDTILPSNLPFKGEITNNLLIMLTVKDKKITSGAMTRPEVYEAIRANGLQEVVKAKYGKNFTMCSTADLLSVIGSKAAPVASVPSAPAVTNRTEAYAAVKSRGLGDAIKAKYGKNFTTCSTTDLLTFLNSSVSNSAVAPVAKAEKAAPVKAAAPAPKPYIEPVVGSPFSDAEIAVMQRSILGK